MKKNFLKLFIFIAILAFCLSAGCASTVRTCAVQYFSAPYFMQPDGSVLSEPEGNSMTVRFRGSGFVWKGRYVLTSEHALRGKNQNIIIYQNFLVSRQVKGEVVRKRGGVALLKLDVKENLPSLSLSDQEMAPGEKVTILDGSRSPAVSHAGTALSSDSLRLDTNHKTVPDGASGSPVLNELNQVVGIVCGVMHINGDTMVLIHSISEIKEGLDLHNL